MGQRTSSDYDGQSLTIAWTPVPYDQMPLSQRLAWDRMWRKLLADEPWRPPGGKDGDTKRSGLCRMGGQCRS